MTSPSMAGDGIAPPTATLTIPQHSATPVQGRPRARWRALTQGKVAAVLLAVGLVAGTTLSSAPSAHASTKPPRLVAFDWAKAQAGKPYIYGGTGPNGYDCSGLMQYILGVAGVRMPRVAADQARTGVVLPYSQAKIGDLLIFANDPTNPGYISHIAMYIGGGKMLEAPHTGDHVKIWPVYTGTLRGAVRVNPQQAARVAAGG